MYRHLNLFISCAVLAVFSFVSYAQESPEPVVTGATQTRFPYFTFGSYGLIVSNNTQIGQGLLLGTNTVVGTIKVNASNQDSRYENNSFLEKSFSIQDGRIVDEIQIVLSIQTVIFRQNIFLQAPNGTLFLLVTPNPGAITTPYQAELGPRAPLINNRITIRTPGKKKILKANGTFFEEDEILETLSFYGKMPFIETVRPLTPINGLNVPVNGTWKLIFINVVPVVTLIDPPLTYVVDNNTILGGYSVEFKVKKGNQAFDPFTDFRF